MPKNKGRNKINGDDAQEVVELVEQLTDGLQDMELRQVQGVFFGRNRYGRITNVDIQYNTEIEVEKPNGRKVTREATVSTSVDIQDIPPNSKLAPFELVNGLIAPAEENRFKILEIIANNGIRYAHPPIFTISNNDFLVYVDKFLIVNIKDETVKEPTTLEELNTLLRPMFNFQRKRIKEIYG